MGERRGTRGLELWCKRMTEGYPGVKVENMTTSWRDGLAFCAIIHHFRPDLIDFSKLDKKDIYHNNNLAFRIAEDHLGIPALLEPEDMVEYSVPDRLSILTYLSQFYQVFAVNSSSPGKVLSKRPPSDLHMVTATGSTPPKKAAYGALGARIREPCAKCGLPVFIAERLNVGKTLYHRTCFRCAKCNTQLTPNSNYDFENGEACCVSCPEKPKEIVIRNQSLSDEEKSASLKRKFDPYSASFEQALEYSQDASLKRSFTLDRMLGGAFQKARSEFMTTQMTSFDTDLEKEPEEKPPDLPVSLKPELLLEDYAHSESNDEIDIDYSLPCFSDNSSVNSDEQVPNNEQCESQEPVTKDSTHAVSMKPSIRPRMKIAESAIHNNSKVKENSHVESEELIPCNPTEELSENEENASNEIVRQEDVSEIISVNDSMTEKKEDSLVKSYIVSDFSECNNSKEIISLSSDNSSDQFPTALKENSVITISSEDCSQYVTERNEESIKSPPIVKYPVDLNPFSDDEDVDDECHPAGAAEPVVAKSVSLNPFGDTDEEDEEEKANESLNPFGSDDDDDDEEVRTAFLPTVKKLKGPEISGYREEDQSSYAPESLRNNDANANKDHSVTFPQPRLRIISKPVNSLTPSGSENLSCCQPATTNINDGTYQGSQSASPQPMLRKLKAPRISLTPLGSEEPGNLTATSSSSRYQDGQSASPQPMLRKLKAPKISLTPLGSEEPSSGHSTATSSPAQSLYGSGRKKRQAPRPPIPQEFNDSPYSSLNSSPSHKEGQLPKSRKTRRAPLPPASTPTKQSLSSQFPTISPIEKAREPSQIKMEMEEITKDEANSLKHDHGRSPSIPIKKLTLKEIEQDLEIVEVQMRGLEKNGVILEKLIREKSEIPGADPDDALSPEVEDMILELFELVNEKCELFRKQTELNYLRRQNRLEREQADIENQLRELMLHPDAHKTDSDKAKEEELLNKMLEIVERRNEIVDRLENDRRREAEEDRSIRTHMSLYSMRRENEHSSSKKSTKKDKQKHEKDKKSKKNKSDSLKSIDDSKQIPKEKKKKKVLNLF